MTVTEATDQHFVGQTKMPMTMIDSSFFFFFNR